MAEKAEKGESSSGPKSRQLDYAGGYYNAAGDRCFDNVAFRWNMQRRQPYNCTTVTDYEVARELKWPVKFAERVRCEHRCRCNNILVTKAHSVFVEELYAARQVSLDTLLERLQMEIDQMNRQLKRYAQIEKAKADAMKNGTSPVDAIKAIKEDPQLVSDPDLTDYSDSEVVDLDEP